MIRTLMIGACLFVATVCLVIAAGTYGQGEMSRLIVSPAACQAAQKLGLSVTATNTGCEIEAFVVSLSLGKRLQIEQGEHRISLPNEQVLAMQSIEANAALSETRKQQRDRALWVGGGALLVAMILIGSLFIKRKDKA